jgi:hypothetical protein
MNLDPERGVAMNLEPILALTLEACQEACQAVKADVFCYSWLDDSFKQRGVRPHHLKELVKRGLLIKVDGSRGGDRAYYRLIPVASPMLA